MNAFVYNIILISSRLKRQLKSLDERIPRLREGVTSLIILD